MADSSILGPQRFEVIVDRDRFEKELVSRESCLLASVFRHVLLNFCTVITYSKKLSVKPSTPLRLRPKRNTSEVSETLSLFPLQTTTVACLMDGIGWVGVAKSNVTIVCE